jgi:ABC-2 type transport system permease protein
MRHTLAVAIKELRQISRDRRTLLILLFIPAFFLFLYGYALNFDIRHVRLAVQDRDATPESRALVSSFVHSDYFTLTDAVSSEAQLQSIMAEGRARAVLVIPEGFGRIQREGGAPSVQVLLDGDNATTASTVQGYVLAVLRDGASTPASEPSAAMTPFYPAVVQPRVWYNPELRSTLFLVPGLIAYISMITAVVATSLSIVKEKERGTMEQIRMAPMSTASFIAGKTLPYLGLSQLSAFMVIGGAMALFGMPMNGSWWLLQLAVALFLVGALGTGLLVSTIAETQQVAFQMSLLIAFLPTFILSGFIFPIASMPIVLQYITLVVPARYFLVALRGVLLKDAPLAVIQPLLAALVAYAGVVLGLTVLRLSRRGGA